MASPYLAAAAPHQCLPRPQPQSHCLIGQLAVDKNYQGQGYAVSLLLFALETALRISETVAGIVTHPFDGGARGFYRRWGFQDLPFNPHRALSVGMLDLQQSLGG